MKNKKMTKTSKAVSDDEKQYMKSYRFKDGELEIALITRSRAKTVHKFMEHCIDSISEINASFSIYDSSSDDSTENIVREYVNCGYIINYIRLPYEYPLGEKYLDSILNSNANYIWPIGDSTAIDFREFANKAYKYIENGADLIVNYGNIVKQFEGIDFKEPKELYRNCLWFMTWLGSEIYHKELYRGILTEKTKKDIIFKMNNGYGSWYPQLGILLEALEQKKTIHTYVIGLNTEGLTTLEKNQAWVKDSLRTWCRDLCLLVDTCGANYKDELDHAIRSTWEILKLDGDYWLCRSRMENGINTVLYEEYDRLGYIDRVSNNKNRIKQWAYMDQDEAIRRFKVIKLRRRVEGKIKRTVRKVYSIFKLE